MAQKRLGTAALEDPQIVQTLLELAEQVESNNISESDARDRVEQVIESLAAYSAVTDLHINSSSATVLVIV